jgi:hypothetical protein
LHRFIDCYCDENYHSLIISGTPPDDVLKSTWETILNEYSEKIGSHEYKLYKAVLKEIFEYRITIDQIHNAVEFLQVVYSEYLCKELNQLLNIDCRFNFQDQKSYQEELKKCLRRCNGIQMKYDLKQIQFQALKEKYEKDADKNKKPDRESFISILITLSDHVKYQINDLIMCSEYVERIKRFTLHAQHLQSINSKK